MNFDLIIRTLLDKASSKQVQDEAKAIAGSLGEIEKKSEGISRGVNDWSKSLEEADRLSKKFGDEFKKRYDAAIASGKSLEQAVAGVRAELEKTNKAPGKGGIDEQLKKANEEATRLRDQIQAIQQAEISRLRQTSSAIGGLGTSALLTGGAITGGIFLAARNYIKDAEEADRLTRRWAVATEDIEHAQERVGRVAAEAVLPLLEKAADVAEQVASFTEAHPEIVQAALNTGLFVTGFGALATAVSRGIKLVADIKYLATIPAQLEAARLQDQAATKQLLAAQQRLRELGVPVVGGAAPRGGGLTSALTSPTAIVALITGTGIASFKAADGIKQLNERLVKMGGPAVAPFLGFLDTTLQTLNPLIPAIKNMRLALERDVPLIQKAIEGLTGATPAAGRSIGVSSIASLGSDLATSSHREEIVATFEDWQREDARIVEEAAAERVRIVSEAEARVTAVTARFRDQVAAINTQADKRFESITKNFRKADLEAEEEYQESRARIIRDGGEEIEDIEADLQERLRKMRLDHEDRMDELARNLDALGIVKEQRRHTREQAEAEREANLEIAERRQDLARRLQELTAQHAAERQKRLEQYEEALAESEAQREEELKQARAARAEEMKEIRKQRAQQLRELQEGLDAERLRRREVFLAQVRDLDAALLGERDLRNKHYAQMLAEAEKFFAAWRAMIPTASGTSGRVPVHDFTGYAMTGLYRMAANGIPQYVLSGGATRAAENIVGGGLTEDSVLSTLARGARSSQSLTINDQSRFDGRISAGQVRAIKRELRSEIIQEFLGA